jgi:hypothetical protein
VFLVVLPDGGEAQESATLDNPAIYQSQKITIGEVENVVILPWGITLPARVDTGATLAALDARNITVRNNIAYFELGNKHRGLWLRSSIVGWIDVRNAVGTQRRPVVEMDVCIGPKLLHTRATLSDRSQMPHPFLVGRSLLSGSFLVDTSQSRAVQPTCPANSSSDPTS